VTTSSVLGSDPHRDQSERARILLFPVAGREADGRAVVGQREEGGVLRSATVFMGPVVPLGRVGGFPFPRAAERERVGLESAQLDGPKRLGVAGLDPAHEQQARAHTGFGSSTNVHASPKRSARCSPSAWTPSRSVA